MKCIADLSIIEKVTYSKEYFILKCTCDFQLPDMSPGQFANIEVKGNRNVFLRRPFSIHDYDKDTNTVSFLIKVIGKGTESLSKLEKGDIINTVLPLGKSFIYDKNHKSLLVGGGSGTAPLYFLSRRLKEIGCDFDIVIGGKSSTDLLWEPDFAELSNTYCTTEDGSKGTKGYVIHHEIFNNITDYKRVYCCGPLPMMKSIANLVKGTDIICQVSLENLMGCGIGVCLCCVTDTVDGRRPVCTMGPIFNINKLTW